MRAYLVGSTGVGKSTLAKLISKRYGLRLLSEIARTEVAKTERSFDDIRNDLDAVSELQRSIFSEQIRAEREVVGDFVSDRAFDNLAYAFEHAESGADLVDSKECEEYVESVKKGGVVFFVRPLPKVVADGVRAKGDLDMAAVWRVDGMCKLLLELFRVPYVPIEGASLKDRWSLVRYVLDLKLQTESRKP